MGITGWANRSLGDVLKKQLRMFNVAFWETGKIEDYSASGASRKKSRADKTKTGPAWGVKDARKKRKP